MTALRDGDSAPSLRLAGEHSPERPGEHSPERPGEHSPERPGEHIPEAPDQHGPEGPDEHSPGRPVRPGQGGPGRPGRLLPRRPGQVGSGRPSRPRRVRTIVAVPVLVGLVIAALALIGVIIALAGVGFSTAIGSTAAASPLAVPAPAVAGGLPRHYQPVRNPATIILIHDFVQRFDTTSGSQVGQPSAVYREPGSLDPVTDQPGWVLYLGYNSRSDLGSPTATVSRLIASLIQTSTPESSWTAEPGKRGGSARCAIALIDNTTVSVCAWATDRTYGALLSPTSDTRGNELAVLMPVMRLDLQPG
ncbi:MAG TPA: hypothetical protein VMR14_17650 [Streptosporangiaceae bacterium]|nr:hypothetical protein [Streptosporangiaceae bacterium]